MMRFIRCIQRAVLNGLKVTGLIALSTINGSAPAQEWSAGKLMRALEDPGHDALMTLIASPALTLAPFKTDGCSGGLSDAWQLAASQYPDFAMAHQSSPPWESCCVTHDEAYHDAAGVLDATASFAARLNADRILRSCVMATGKERVDEIVEIYQVSPQQIEAAYAAVAQAMFVAVRLGGAPCSGLPWRWGYGYPSCSVFAGAFD